MKIHAGKKYEARNGLVHGPIQTTGRSDFPFRAGPHFWTAYGYRRSKADPSPMDLVKEHHDTAEHADSVSAAIDAMLAATPDDEPEKPYTAIERAEPEPLSLIDQIAPIVVLEALTGFPSRYSESLSGDHWFSTFRKAKKVLESGGNTLFCGTRGGGKTRMAYELARRAVIPRDHSKPKRIFKTAMRIFLEIRDTYRKSATRSELEIMDELASARLLVIDECQERGESTFESAKLTSIIDDRYRHKLPTILIANLSPENFRETLGPSICDRVNEDGGMLVFDWESFRK